MNLNVAVLDEALELLDFAFCYDQVMYCYDLADRGQFEVRYDALAQMHRFRLRFER